MKLYLVRHGESECNVQRRLYGRTDCSLTEKGCRQAREVGVQPPGGHALRRRRGWSLPAGTSA